MEFLEQVKQIYAQYLTELSAARAKAKPADGLFGFGAKLSDDACNAIFSTQLEKLLTQAAAEGVDAQQAEAIVRYVCGAANEHRADDVAYWLMLAMQQYVQPLLPLLGQEQAKALCGWYREAYPWKDRLPVQETFFAALCARAGEKTHKKWFEKH